MEVVVSIVFVKVGNSERKVDEAIFSKLIDDRIAIRAKLHVTSARAFGGLVRSHNLLLIGKFPSKHCLLTNPPKNPLELAKSGG
jgi:hypothetical protein